MLRANEGPKYGVPFIDDHIHTSEAIVDYLTEYSGINCGLMTSHPVHSCSRLAADGDLDPHMSRHTLVPLKVAYKKLRLLVDLGCVFIGHGLKKDFRIISESFRPMSPRMSLIVSLETFTFLPTVFWTPWTSISSKQDIGVYPFASSRGWS